MIRMSLTSVWARRRRLAGIAVAVVLGTAFLSGTLVLGDTLSANFDRLFADVSGGTDVVVRNATAIGGEDRPTDERGLIDQALLDRVATVDGVADAEAQVVGFGQLLGRDDQALGGNGPPRLAGSWIDNPDLNPYQLAEGRPPETADEVVVNRGAAEAGDLGVGDTTTVQTPAPVEVTIVGIATFGDVDGLGETTWTAFTLEGAQEHVTGEPGQVNTILAQAEPDVGSDELAQRVQAEVGDGADVITGSELAGERSDDIADTFLTMLRMFLVVFAGIALVVATLTISNSFSVTVAQRTRELALLRAVGASRRQVRGMVSLEALILGAVAAVVGAGLGLGVAGGLKALFDAFGFALPAGGLEIRPLSIALAVGAGLAATLAGAQLAARRASSVAPIEALRDASAEQIGINPRRLVAGAGAGVLTVALISAAAASESVVLVGVGALAAVAAVLMVAPAVLPLVAGTFGRGLRRLRGVNGVLAEENTRRNPRRSAATATALVVGVAVVTVFTVLAASLKVTLEDEMSSDFNADLAVTTPEFGGGLLDPALAGELEALPEVSQAVGLGDESVRLDGDATTVTAADMAKLTEVAQLEVVDSTSVGDGRTALAVSSDRAESEGWTLGTTVDMTFADGATDEVTVATLYEDNSLMEDLVIQPELWSEHASQLTSRMVLVTTAGGVGEDQAREAMAPLAEAYGGDVQNSDDFASAMSEGLDLMLGVVYALLALAIIIALLGIGNTLSLATYERRRELGLLRAVGQTRRQVRSVLRLESVIIATFGTLTGLVLGGVLAWGFVATLLAGEGGAFVIPSTRLAIIAVLGAVAGVLAALRPARRAARLPILDAIAAG